jgi:hypothetical protein
MPKVKAKAQPAPMSPADQRDKEIAALIRGEIAKQEKISKQRGLLGDTATLYRIAGLRMALAFVDPAPHR